MLVYINSDSNLAAEGLINLVKNLHPTAIFTQDTEANKNAHYKIYLTLPETELMSLRATAFILSKDDAAILIDRKIKPPVLVLQSCPRPIILEALINLTRGLPYVSEAFKVLTQKHLAKETIEEGKLDLSNREREIIFLLQQGYTSKQIADVLKLSFETVKTHRKRINKKLGVKNVQQLLVFCKENSLL
ncbi:MAG: response regulator transcription factor [Luteibaculaceae bacterium]